MGIISDRLGGAPEVARPKLKTLLFSNPVFHTGLNVTCRNGFKWAESLNQVVEVRDTDETTNYGLGYISGVLTLPLNQIPEEILKFEHDPSCRTSEGIITEMRNVYGEGLKEDSPTTVLFFEFMKDIE
jgi:hypothetical protein